jgi:hypothetical protein
MTLQISTLKAKNAVCAARMRAIHFRFGTNHFNLEQGYASAGGEAERRTANVIAQRTLTSWQQGQTARERTPAAADENVSEKQLIHCASFLPKCEARPRAFRWLHTWLFLLKK